MKYVTRFDKFQSFPRVLVRNVRCSFYSLHSNGDRFKRFDIVRTINIFTPARSFEFPDQATNSSDDNRIINMS